jgi:hypothetical protein
MELKPVLYSILMAYAIKKNTPYIDCEDFISFVEKHARRNAGEQPAWAVWAKHTSRKVWEEMTPLVEEKKCKILTEKTGIRIFMPDFYIDILENAYMDPDETAAYPFPSVQDLKITIPSEYIRSLNVVTDLVTYLDHPQAEPMPLIMLTFPDGVPSALVLSTMIPRRLSESAMLKIRQFLRTHDNKGYLQNKLIPYYQGNENQMKDLFTRIMVRPLDCLTNLEDGEDFPYLFWTRFCGIARGDIGKKNELLYDDFPILQSLHIISIMNTYSRAKAFQRKERDLALNDLDSKFDQAPYAYSLEDIVHFTNSKGIPLLGLFSEEDLQSWLTARISSGNGEELPEIFLIGGPSDVKRYIKRENFFGFCVKCLTDSRPIIKKAVLERWAVMLKSYRKEPAMETDEEFEKLLRRLTGEFAPELLALITDKKLFLVCDEMERIQRFIPDDSRFFGSGEALLPMSTLFLVKRKEILTNIRADLPFWYSIALIVSIAGFFRKLKDAQLAKGAKKKTPGGTPAGSSSTEKSREAEILAAGRKLESELVPYGEDIDSCLEALENRWNTLLNSQARQDLLTDVKTLIRDRLRKAMHGQKNLMVTRNSLENIATRIAGENSTLRDLKTKGPLEQYIVLYMVKLLVQQKS